MRSFISSAVLASAVFGQTAFSAVSAHRHSHAHHHHAAKAEKRGANIVSSVLSKVGVVAAANTGSIFSTDNSNNGPFVIDFCNDSGKDIVVVLWSAVGEEAQWTSMCVNKNAPTLTESVPAGENITVYVNPGQSASISGAWAALYPNTNLSPAGSINNTWGEFTYTTETQFSAVDVTRLINMAGNEMSIETWASNPPSGDALCKSDMDTCVFKCTPDASGNVPNICPGGSLFACEGENTQNFAGTSGGCGGFTASGGYTKVSFGA